MQRDLNNIYDKFIVKVVVGSVKVFEFVIWFWPGGSSMACQALRA